MHERMLAGILCVACLIALPARAQDDEAAHGEDLYSRQGVYLQALFTNNIGGYAFGGALDNDAQYSTGIGGALGYRIHEHVAAEIYGDWVAGWRLKGPGVDRGDAVAGTIGINAKGYLHGGRFQPYALFGLGAAYAERVRTRVSSGLEWDMAIRLGVGFDWYATEEVGFTFAPMWVQPLGIGANLSDFQYVSIGIGAFLRFGGE